LLQLFLKASNFALVGLVFASHLLVAMLRLLFQVLDSASDNAHFAKELASLGLLECLGERLGATCVWHDAHFLLVKLLQALLFEFQALNLLLQLALFKSRILEVSL